MQFLVWGQKNTVEIFVPRFQELGEALNMKGCWLTRGETLGILEGPQTEFDEKKSKVQQTRYFQLYQLFNLR